MSFIDDQFDDYLNYGIAEEDDDYIYEQDDTDGNERLNRYYNRTYNQRKYEEEMDLYR